MSSKIKIKCDYCGKEFLRDKWSIHNHNFCCRRCHWDFNSKEKNPEGYAYRDFSKNSERFTKMNKELNPTRMTQETKKKIRHALLNTGSGKSYEKYYGRHKHRVVAEEMLGRPLKPGEIVHHIDGNKRNNDPDNLMVFASKQEHVKWHAEHDPEWGKEKNEIQAS